MPIYRLPELYLFPDPEEAEDGIVAIGGDLASGRLLEAYRNGIFPWYNREDPIIWWSPDPRCVLFPEELKVSKSMKQLLKRKAYRVTFNQAFAAVIRQCAEVRYKDRSDTWLNEDMIASYTELHRIGVAHSVEVWEGEELCGGLYGLALGKCFFGESMFHTRSNASKYGFITLVEKLRQLDFALIDCQVYNPHLESLGAVEIPREIFISLLKRNVSDDLLVLQ